MNIKIIRRYYDKTDHVIYEEGAERKVSEDRGAFLIQKGFAAKNNSTENLFKNKENNQNKTTRT